MPSISKIDFISAVNRKLEPFVIVKLDGEPAGQLSVEEARQHGLTALEVAEAAVQDAMFVRFMMERVGCDFEQAGAMLMDFRRIREQVTGKKLATTSIEDAMPAANNKQPF